MLYFFVYIKKHTERGLNLFGSGVPKKYLSSFIIILLFVQLLVGLLTISPSLVKAYGNGFTYSRSITIDHTKVPNTDQSNFPVLVSGTYTYLKTTGNGGLVQNASGYDVGFYTNSDCSTGKMNWETETYTATTGVVNYWVKVATASHTSDTVFYMCYGNSSITTDQSSATSVWDSNFKGVWHLPNGTSLTANDSTSNANNGTITTPTATTGQIDGGASFNGTTDRIVPSADPINGLSSFTTSAWIKVAADQNSTILGNRNNEGSPIRITGFQLEYSKTGNGYGVNDKSLIFITGSTIGDSNNLWATPTNSISLNTWYYATWVWTTGSRPKIYINGTSQTLTD